MSRASPRYRRNNPSLTPVGAGNGVALVRYFGLIEGQMTINTFMYSAPQPTISNTQMATLLTNVNLAILNQYVACLSADWSVVKQTLDLVHRNDVIGVVATTLAGNPGGRPVNHLPSEVAAVLIRYSGFKGQHGRGRLGLPAIAVGDVTFSKITAAAELAALNTLAGAMLATASDGSNTWTPCVGQRALTSPKLVTNFSSLTRVVVNPILGTVRRRKLGRGK